MKHNKVGSVMTPDVVRATYGTPFKEVARLLAGHGISGLPVVDGDNRVIGVISETDVMARQAETADPYEHKHRFPLAALTRSARRQAAKATARTAGQLMTEPPVTVHAEATILSRPPGPWPTGAWNGCPSWTRRTASSASCLPATRHADPRRGDRGGAGPRPVPGVPHRRRIRDRRRRHARRAHGAQGRLRTAMGPYRNRPDGPWASGRFGPMGDHGAVGTIDVPAGTRMTDPRP